MKLGLMEFAYYKYLDIQNDASVDIQDGIKKKKIDVLEWEYREDSQLLDDPFKKHNIPNSALLFLTPYVNPLYSPDNKNTVFSF
jgi:hypothetical protein